MELKLFIYVFHSWNVFQYLFARSLASMFSFCRRFREIVCVRVCVCCFLQNVFDSMHRNVMYTLTIRLGKFRPFSVLLLWHLFKKNPKISISTLETRSLYVCVFFSISCSTEFQNPVVYVIFVFYIFSISVQLHRLFCFYSFGLFLQIGKFFWVSNLFSYNICSIKYGIEHVSRFFICIWIKWLHFVVVVFFLYSY